MSSINLRILKKSATDRPTDCQRAESSIPSKTAFVGGIINDFTVFAFQEQAYHVLACSILRYIPKLTTSFRDDMRNENFSKAKNLNISLYAAFSF